MDRKKNAGKTVVREDLDDEATNELTALDPAATAASQIAATTDDSAVDPNVLALRRVDTEIRQLMVSWVDLESQLNNRDAEIRRLSDRGRSVEEDVQATRHELAAARSDCERLRGEGADQRAQAEVHKRLQHEHREHAEKLQLALVAARGRIDELAGELAKAKAGREKLENQLAEHRDALIGMAAQLRKFEKSEHGHADEKAALAARIVDMDRISSEVTSNWRDTENAGRQAKEQLLAISRRAEGLENELRQAREAASQLEQKLDEKVAASKQAFNQAAAAVENQQKKAEAAVIAAAGEREKFLATIAERDLAMVGLRDRVSVLDVERAQLLAQLDELRAQLAAADSEFQAKRKSIAALGTEFNRLGLMQANVRKLDGMMSRQLSGSGLTSGEAERPRNGRLIVSLDGDNALKYPLFKSDMVIGRARDTDIRVAGRHMSRRHARVFIDHGVVMIEDLGSLNGITVNGKTVRKHELHDGDVLNVGGSRLRFVDLDEKADASGNKARSAH